MSFSQSYLQDLISIISKIDTKKIDEIVNYFIQFRKGKGRVFFLGVGGSAANASHAVNDFRKLTRIEAYAPTDNVSELTARTNDEGWDTVFSEWLKVSRLSREDCIFILSVGGGNKELEVSTNLCKAIDLAKNVGSKIIGIVGREDGETFRQADICILIPAANMLMVTPYAESCQSIIWHLIVSHPDLKVNETKW